MPFVCKICKKIYSTQFNLNKHCRRKHNIKMQEVHNDGNLFNFKCLDCSCSFQKSLHLIEHLRNAHDQKISEERLEFQTLEEFQSWKYDVEQKELCSYVVWSGKKTLNSEEVKYFTCNRSGNRMDRIRDAKNIINRKRNTKKQSSARLNYNCISKITLKRKGTKFVAWRIINHYGHSTEIQHLRISPLDRQELTSKLVDGVSVRMIPDDTRNQISADPKRIDLSTRRDLENIKRSYIDNQNNTSSCSSQSQITTTSDSESQNEEKPVINECLNFSHMSNLYISSRDRKENILKELTDLRMLVHDQDYNQLNDAIFEQIITSLQTAKSLLQLPSTLKKESYLKDVTKIKIHPKTEEKTVNEMENSDKDEDRKIAIVSYKSCDILLDHSYI